MSSKDFIHGASAAADNSVFFAGSSSGQWAAAFSGGSDVFAAKLGSNGTVLWAWQVTAKHSFSSCKTRRIH